MTCGQRASAASSVAVPDATERDVGGPQRVAGVPVEQRQRQLLQAEPVERGLEAVARRPRGERHQEARVGLRVVDRRGGLQHEIAVHVELGGAASRQQREHRLRRRRA